MNSVGFSRRRDPRQVPQFTLWTLRKDGKVREARTRILPIGDGLLELGVYELRTDGTLDLLWAQTLGAGDVRELAQRVQREYEVEGWTTDPVLSH